jgi:nicotinate phosphoribosyltransferase
MAIIKSLLDTDLYKITMGQAVLHQFPGAKVEYIFKCRNDDINLAQYKDEIQKEIDDFCTLTLNNSELSYLGSLPYIKQDYVDFMELYHPNKDHILMETKGNELEIKIKGSWFLSIYFEVPVLAIISEIYSRNVAPDPDMKEARRLLQLKKELIAKNAESFKFADFGTRRRFSLDWQDEIIGEMKNIFPKNMLGTSNILLAKKHGVNPIGTMAHEWLQCGQAVGVRLVDSQKYMLQKWVDEYRGNLGIALSDVIGIEAFLDDFDAYFAKLYDGVRQDSGDPYVVGEKMIEHYKKLKVDPKTKTIIFSDALDFEKALALVQHFKDRIGVSLGIGTNLTNNIPNFKPLNIVLKVTSCNGQPVAKISDSDGKQMCNDESFLKYLKHVFDERHKAMQK